MYSKLTREELEKRVQELEKEVFRLTREAGLLDEEKRYRSLAQISSDLLWEVDANRRYTFVSSGVCEILGYEPEDVVGRTPFDFMPQEEARQLEAVFAQIVAERRSFALLERVNLHRNGRRVVLETSGVPVFDSAGRFSGYQGMDRDITERKLAEEALREKERLLREVFEQTFQFMGLLTADGMLIKANRNALQFTGVQESEVLGKPFWEIPWWACSAEQQEALRGAVEKASAGVIVCFEASHLSADGNFHQMDLSLKPVMGESGGVDFLIVEARDITGCKNVEARLRTSESRLSRAEIVARFGNWEFHLDSNEVYASEGAKIIYGLEGNRWSIPRVQTIPLSQYRNMLDNALTGLIKEGKPYNVEFKIRRPSDGKILDIHSIAEYSPERNIVFGVIQDITERKQAEEALRDNEARLRAITDSARDAIMMTDPEGVITFWNPAAESILGYSREEARGQNLHRLLAPSRYHASYDEAFPKFTETGQGEAVGKTLELVARRKDGEEIPIELSLSAVFLNGWHAVGLLRDITERKRAAETLRESEEFLSSIVENIPHMIFIKEAEELKFIRFNKAGEKLLGYQRRDLIGKNDHDLFPKEQADFFTIKDREVLRSGSLYDIPEEPIDTKMGRRILHTKKIPIGDKSGSPAYLLGISEDITERKQAEKELQDSHQRMQSIIQGYPIPAFVIGKDHRVIYWNKALEELSQVKANEVLGSNLHWRAFYDTQRPTLADLMVDGAAPKAISRWYGGISLKSGCVEGAYEATDFFPNIGGDGKWLHFTAAPIGDSVGMIVGAIETLEDVTARNKAAEALRRSEEKYRELVENANSIILRMDSLGNVIFINEFAQRFFGYSEEEILGRNVVGTIVPQIESTTGRDLQLMIEDIVRDPDRYASNVNENMCSSGERVWVVWANKPIRQENGRVVEVLCVGNDITERKRAEEALLESRRQFADIINFLPDATFVIDTKGKIIAWNRAIEEMTGARAIDMLGKGNYEYALPFYGNRRPVLIDLVFVSDEELMQKYNYIRKRGESIIIETDVPMGGKDLVIWAIACPLYDSRGNIVGAIESIRDITERKQMQKALVAAEAKYRSIFENSVTGIYQTTPEGRFLSVNMAFARMLGYHSPEEVLSMVTDLCRQVYYYPEQRAELLRLVEARGEVQDFEVQFFRKDRSTAWINLNLRIVRDQNGKISYYEGTAADITDKKMLQAQLNQANKMEAIGTLAGGIAHDFNNILAPIIGYSEMSLRTVAGNSRLHRNLEVILSCGLRAKELVKQILTFSRRTEAEHRAVLPSLLVKEIIKLLRSSLPSTIEIRQDIEANTMDSAVMTDPTEVHRVLMNLCTNAAHAMREKGGVLSISLKRVNVDSSGCRDVKDLEAGAYLKLSVADTGHGMNEAIMQRIYEPYFTTKGPSEGTGLGLALVYGIVKNLGGGIAVTSEPGRGTNFDVYFPVSETIQATTVHSLQSLPTGKGLVMVVDDEEDIVDLLKAMLESLGYGVIERYRSTDALHAFKSRPGSFDLVISDLTMPHMTGIDLAREIHKVRADVPIILCTGFSETLDESRRKLLGIRGVLMKPVSIRDLADTVNAILGENKGTA